MVAVARTTAREMIVGERLEKEFLVDVDDVKKMAEIMSARTMKKICWVKLS